MWLEFDKGNSEFIIHKQRHQIYKNVLRQNQYFSTRLSNANRKVRDFWMNMVNLTYNSTEDTFNKLQKLKGKTKLKFYKNISNYYN